MSDDKCDSSDAAFPTGRLAKPIDFHTLEGRVQFVRFSPMGERLACCDFASTVTLFEPQEPRLIWQRRFKRRLTTMIYSPSGSHIACGGFANKAVLLDAIDGTSNRELELGGAVRCLAFSSNGSMLAAGDNSQHVSILDVIRGGVVLQLSTDGIPATLCFSPDDASLACGDSKMMLSKIDINRKITVWKQEFGGALSRVWYSLDGHDLYSTDQSSTATLLDAASGAVIQHQHSVGGLARSIAVSRDCTKVAIGSYREKLVSLINHWEFQLKGWACSLAFSPNGKLFACADTSNQLNVMSVSRGQVVQQHATPAHAHALEFSADGTELVFGDYERNVVCIDIASGDILWSVELPDISGQEWRHRAEGGIDNRSYK